MILCFHDVFCCHMHAYLKTAHLGNINILPLGINEIINDLVWEERKLNLL